MTYQRVWLIGAPAGRAPYTAAATAPTTPDRRGRRLLDFIAIVGQDVPKTRPALFRYRDCGTEVCFHFRYTHVDASVILT